MDISGILQNFEKKGYRALYFEQRADAVSFLKQELCGERIGFGGSATLDELGLFDVLSEQNEVYWHWRVPEGETQERVRRIAAECEVYFTSANGVSADGKIVNIDGTANRVAAYLYGKKRVYFICGKNKICEDEEAAVFRARNVAAPINTRRLGMDTPCAETGRCHDCKSPQRICRALNVLWEKPNGADMTVIFLGEDLGY